MRPPDQRPGVLVVRVIARNVPLLRCHGRRPAVGAAHGRVQTPLRFVLHHEKIAVGILAVPVKSVQLLALGQVSGGRMTVR